MYEIMKTKPSGKVLYRYSDGWYEISQYTGIIIKPCPRLETFPVIRETEKSYFIIIDISKAQRVPKTGKNIYAWDSEKKALFNYFKRKERHLKFLKRDMDRAEANLEWAAEELRKIEKHEVENPVSTILNF